MDRLVCGDVGFGKTEVALRSAFVAAMNGKQVAVVVPTTLLSRQHFATFQARFKGLPLQHRAGLAPGAAQGDREDQGRAGVGRCRHRGRHPCAAGREHQVPRSGPADHRRGAAFRREAQGTPEGDAHQRACADPHGDAHSAHPAAGAVGRAGTLAHHHAAAGPSGGAHLHLALRSRDHPREPAARAFPWRPEFLCGAAHHRSRRDRGLPARERAGGEVPHRPWPHGADRARRHHDRLLRPAVRRAAVDDDRGVGPRHSDRQHADHPSRRHVRPGPALSAPRPRRAARSSAPMRCSPHPPTARSPPPPTSG